MRIVVGAATALELQPLLHAFQAELNQEISFAGHRIHCISTGVGSTYTACSWLSNPKAHEADFWMMLGIAGSFTTQWTIGSLVEVTSETWGDLGVEHADASFEDVFSAGLIEPNQFPYREGKLYNPNTYTDLPKVAGLTVQMTSGAQKTIQERIFCSKPDVESMEGAGFFHASLAKGVSFCQLRAISNQVEPRDKSRWDIRGALQHLTEKTLHFLENF